MTKAPLDLDLYPHHPDCYAIQLPDQAGPCNCARRNVAKLIEEAQDYRAEKRVRARQAAEDLAYADEETWELLKIIEPVKVQRLRELLGLGKPEGPSVAEETDVADPGWRADTSPWTPSGSEEVE